MRDVLGHFIRIALFSLPDQKTGGGGIPIVHVTLKELTSRRGEVNQGRYTNSHRGHDGQAGSDHSPGVSGISVGKFHREAVVEAAGDSETLAEAGRVKTRRPSPCARRFSNWVGLSGWVTATVNALPGSAPPKMTSDG